MDFQHSGEIWRDFPELVPGIVFAEGITPDVSVGDRAAKFTAIASSRLAERTESELPEVQAWRRAFAKIGLKPTQRQSRCCGASARKGLSRNCTPSSGYATPSHWPSPSR